jgi:hypothetical protein
MKKYLILSATLVALIFLINCEVSEEPKKDDKEVGDPTENWVKIANSQYLVDTQGSSLSPSISNGTWLFRELNFYSVDDQSRVKIRLYSQTIGKTTGTFQIADKFANTSTLYATVYFLQENNWEYYSNFNEPGIITVTKLSGENEYKVDLDLTLALNEQYDIEGYNELMTGNFTGVIETVENNPS